MIHPLLEIILQIEFAHFSHRSANNGFDFIVQPGGEGGIKTIDFDKINFPVHFVAYKNKAKRTL